MVQNFHYRYIFQITLWPHKEGCTDTHIRKNVHHNPDHKKKKRTIKKSMRIQYTDATYLCGQISQMECWVTSKLQNSDDKYMNGCHVILFWIFYYSKVDLQGCVNFCCTAHWPKYIYIYIYIYIYTNIYTLFFSYYLTSWSIPRDWI